MSDRRPVRLSTGGEVKAECWIGTTEDLEHLVKTCDELRQHIESVIESRFIAGTAERRAAFDAQRYSFTSDVDHEARWPLRESAIHEEMLKSAQLVLSVESVKWNSRVSGSPEEVLQQIEDPKDVKKITLTIGTEHNMRLRERSSLDVVIDRKWGAEATLLGYETNWIALASGKLSEEFKRARPWYAWMRSAGGLTVIVGVPLIALVAAAYLATLAKANLVSVLITELSLTFLILVGLNRLVHAAVPRFRLLPPGERLKSGRAVAVGIGAWLTSTVVMPVLVSLLMR